ncbi:hypothetical protein CR513_27710, partial [Mucuna pruriens]
MSKAEWTRHLDEASKKSIRWYPQWNKREDTIIRYGGFLNAPKELSTTIRSWCQDKRATPWLYPRPRKPSHPSSYTTRECRIRNALRRSGKPGGVLLEKNLSWDPGAAEPHLATRLGARAD